MTQKTITYCDKPECGKEIEVIRKYTTFFIRHYEGNTKEFHFCPTHAEELEKMFGIKIRK